MLTPWKKSYDQPRQCVKKQRYYFANKGPSSQSYGFSSSHVWMWEYGLYVWLSGLYGLSCVWTIKKAEHWRIDAFELWCWRRLLRVPWTARRSNQSILKEISPDYLLKDGCWSWSWSSNTFTTWCVGWFIRKDPDAGKDWRQNQRGRQRLR